jgi:hypothetical protein
MFARLLPIFAFGAVLMSGCTLIVEEEEVAPTEVSVRNDMDDLNYNISYIDENVIIRSFLTDSVDLYGVRVGGARFDVVSAGETTPYRQVSQSGAVTVLIDSVVLKNDDLEMAFDDIDALSYTVVAQQQNTLTFDGGSVALFGALGKKAVPAVR